MLRQFLVFYRGEIIFTHSFALGLNIDELNKAKEIMQKVSISDKIISRSILKYQIFHHRKDEIQYSFITDINDPHNYIDKILKNTIHKFLLFFPDPNELKEQFSSKEAFVKYLIEAQHELHTKIALIGPLNSGKTTLYNLVRNNDEHSIMNFAKSSTVSIADLKFDLWDNILDDNYSLLWSKIIGGSDLIILLFDASNYNLKVLNHFLSLYKKESNLAKLLVIANKTDLVSIDEIKRIKTELDNIAIKELSLINSNAKSLVFKYISDILQLKKGLPANFEELIKQAENLEQNGNTVGAIAKYKELMNICSAFQELDYENEFMRKCDELNLKLTKAIEERKEEQKKIKFTPFEAIKFSKKVNIKQLPTKNPTSAPSNIVPETGFLKNSEENNFENQKKKIESQIIRKKSKKLKLKPSDIKINLEGIIDQERSSQISTQRDNVNPPELEIDPNALKTDNDYANALQIMITREGGQLNINLCLEFIEKIKNILGRELIFNDLLIAKQEFIKQENKS